MSEPPITLDERNTRTVHGVCTVMYGITMVLLAATVLYRQFGLGQPVREFEDIAIILTLNVVVGLGALLYLGGVTFPRVSPGRLAAGYAGFVVLGLAFTLFKYAVLLDGPMGAREVWGAFLTVATVCGLLTGLYVLMAYLGYRRLEREAGEPR